MPRPIDILRGLLGQKKEAATPPREADCPFELRLAKLDQMRPVSVSRAVLFRTQAQHQEV